MENYYVRAEIEEEVPDYEFVVKAKDYKSAVDIASKTIEEDYPEKIKK